MSTPKSVFHVGIHPVDAAERLKIYEADTLVPYVIDSILTSRFMSLTLLNNHVPARNDAQGKFGWIHVVSASVYLVEEDIMVEASIPLLNSVYIGKITTYFNEYLAPRQTFPLPIWLEYDNLITSQNIRIHVIAMDLDTKTELKLNTGNIQLNHVSWGCKVFKYTFQGYDNSVQYGNLILAKF